jgi:hypothetical protein
VVRKRNAKSRLTAHRAQNMSVDVSEQNPPPLLSTPASKAEVRAILSVAKSNLDLGWSSIRFKEKQEHAFLGTSGVQLGD